MKDKLEEIQTTYTAMRKELDQLEEYYLCKEFFDEGLNEAVSFSKKLDEV